MKKIILFAGLSLATSTGFSQQVSTARNAEIKPAENKEAVSTGTVADSVAVLHSMSRTGQAILVPVSIETKQTGEQQPGKGTVSSASRKPD